MEGIVKYFDAVKLYGFVQITSEYNDWLGVFFFHYSSIIGEPVRAGDRVEFWLDDSPDVNDTRPVAVDIPRAKAGPRARERRPKLSYPKIAPTPKLGDPRHDALGNLWSCASNADDY
jgi:cold shock CspA family protein